MYLKLSVAGHLTIFLTRTRGPFWSIRPARILWIAVLGTQIIATLIAVYGLFMTPLGWGWAGFVWGYALLWFLLNDRVKLLAYRVFDPTVAPLLAKKPVDLTPQIATRAMISTSSKAAGKAMRSRTGNRRNRRFEKMNPINKQTRISRWALPGCGQYPQGPARLF
jgi:H+-transporting ATPase